MYNKDSQKEKLPEILSNEQLNDMDKKAEEMIARAQEAFDRGDYKSLDEAVLVLGEEFGVEMQLPSFEIDGKEFPVSRLKIGGKSPQEIQDELRAKNININPYAQDILNKVFQSEEFQNRQQNPEQIQLVRLTVGDLGFPNGATTDQIYARAQELGLDLCPPEVGPYQRLKDADQPMGEWYQVAMKTIADRDGDPNVFTLGRAGGGLWLNYAWTYPTRHWDPDYEFLFRLRKSSGS